MMYPRIFPCIAAACCAQAAAAAEEGGILYGHSHAVSIAAPPGWVLDNKSGAANGVHAAIYPVGGTWAGSPAVMYANCSDKNERSGATLADFIDTDVKKFRDEAPGIEVKKLPPEFHAGASSSAMYFNTDINREAVVYVDEDKSVCMLVLSSKTDKNYTSSLPSYKAFLGTYKFLSNDVQLPGEPPQPEHEPATQPATNGTLE